MIYEPDDANDHESNNDRGDHVSGGTCDPERTHNERPENWHREDHLGQGTDSHKGSPRRNFLTSLTLRLTGLAVSGIGRCWDP